MDGQGRLSMPDGSVFEGQFQNGKFHGHGVYCWSDGSKYEGMAVYTVCTFIQFVRCPR